MNDIFTKKQLKEFEHFYFESHPEVEYLDLQVLYVVPSKKDHSSGFKFLNIYGISYNKDGSIYFSEELSDCADILHFKFSDSLDKEYSIGCLHIDYPEEGVTRYFLDARHRFRITFSLSDFKIEIVKSDIVL